MNTSITSRQASTIHHHSDVGSGTQSVIENCTAQLADANDVSAEQRLVDERIEVTTVRLNRMFAVLMLVQAAFAILFAFTLTPKAWEGWTSNVHTHVWASVLLGSAMGLFPAVLGWFYPNEKITRFVIAIAQLGFSALLIHIAGGRSEMHFHVFVSLAFLSLYRDPKVLIVATLTIAVDHLARAMWFPRSVFGLADPAIFLALEHAVWVLIEDSVLFLGIAHARSDARLVARQQIAVDRSHRQLQESISQIRPILDRAAHGDLTSCVPKIDDPVVGPLCGDLARTLDAWKSVINTVLTSVSNVAGASSHLRDATSGLAGGMREQSQTFGTIQSSLSSLRKSIEEIQTNSVSVRDASNQAMNVAERGREALSQSENAMHAIQESSTRITQAISAIQSLADQTNLLALNATIEAARAGDAGRGFTIVANEVKNLAKMSSESAEEIAQLIEDSRLTIASGVEASHRTTNQFKLICDSVMSVRSQMDNILSTTNSQNSYAGQLNESLDRLERVNRVNEETGSRLNDEQRLLDDMSQQLAECAAHFDIGSSNTKTVTRPDHPTAQPTQTSWASHISVS